MPLSRNNKKKKLETETFDNLREIVKNKEKTKRIIFTSVYFMYCNNIIVLKLESNQSVCGCVVIVVVVNFYD